MSELIYTLTVTHITIVCVTLFLHRGQAHRGFSFHPVLSHFMRFWLWLTTGMVTKEWVAVHRKHHRYCEQEGDPHSPQIYGFWHVLFRGSFLYTKAAADNKMVEQYGVGTPDDLIEKFYTKYSWLGLLFMLTVDCVLFGYTGLLVWLVQIIWIPFFAAGVINGLGHWWGYRNGETKDHSRNISPIGFLIGGEELHNNHHLDPRSVKLSQKWFEFDIGWFYAVILSKLGLLKINFR